MINLMQGDCLERMKELPDNSVDSIVTDPPYGLSFMGKHWDKGVPSAEIWAEALRVLKPGGHLLAFAGTRTQHRMAVNIEDAGFEIRDMIAWVYGSGFPKSLNVSKAIDKKLGTYVEGKLLPSSRTTGASATGIATTLRKKTASNPQAPEAQEWEGWGTALKPALEPITVARKPFKGTVAANVLAHGTGALNIDECRVPSDDGECRSRPPRTENRIYGGGKGASATESHHNEPGRWPANLIHDGSDEVLELFPHTKSGARNGVKSKHGGKHGGIYGAFEGGDSGNNFEASSGSAARFFYCAKASKKDRGDGNKHPTVKPTDLMRYLCRLVTPPNGIVLDPFMGSGSTGKAARLEGFRFIGIEMDENYFNIATQRIVGGMV